MITGMSDTKLPPFPRDSKAPLDTPPAYSERPTTAPASASASAPAPSLRQVYPTRAPREVYTTPAPQAQAAYAPSVPPAAGPSSFQGPPQQFTHSWPPPSEKPPSPTPSDPYPHLDPYPHPDPYPHLDPYPHIDPYPHPGDVSSYHSSSTSTSTSKGKGKGKGQSAGAKVARVMGQGMFALVALPVVATAAAVYGSGKLVEGIGRGLISGPEAVLKAYRKVDGKIKGDDVGGYQEDADAREREWHRYQYQQQQRQEEEREWAEAASPMGDFKQRSGSLQMPKASLMEDPSIGMAGGSGSMKR